MRWLEDIDRLTGGRLLPMLAVAVLAALVLSSSRAILDASRRPRDHWGMAGHNKTLWMLGLATLGPHLTGRYRTVVRPRLDQAADRAANPFDPSAFGVPAGGMQYRDGGFRPAAPTTTEDGS